jgi:hypothetical protein
MKDIARRRREGGIFRISRRLRAGILASCRAVEDMLLLSKPGFDGGGWGKVHDKKAGDEALAARRGKVRIGQTFQEAVRATLRDFLHPAPQTLLALAAISAQMSPEQRQNPKKVPSFSNLLPCFSSKVSKMAEKAQCHAGS